MIRKGIIVCLTLAGLLAPARLLADDESPAEAARKALDKEITLDYVGQSLQDAIQHLREKTKLNIALDMFAIQQTGIFFEDPNMPAPQVHLKVTKGKVRQGLQRLLQPYNLTYVILGDSVLITTEEMGLHRQMRQRIQVDVDKTPLDVALKKLAKAHGISLVIDPKVAKDAQSPISLQLEDATLETSVRLMAEMGGLKSVRLGNVLFVTNEAKADKLRKEDKHNTPYDPNSPPFVRGMIDRGIGVAPPAIPVNPPPANRVPNVAPAQPPINPDGAVAPPRPRQPQPPANDAPVSSTPSAPPVRQAPDPSR